MTILKLPMLPLFVLVSITERSLAAWPTHLQSHLTPVRVWTPHPGGDPGQLNLTVFLDVGEAWQQYDVVDNVKNDEREAIRQKIQEDITKTFEGVPDPSLQVSVSSFTRVISVVFDMYCGGQEWLANDSTIDWKVNSYLKYGESAWIEEHGVLDKWSKYWFWNDGMEDKEGGRKCDMSLVLEAPVNYHYFNPTLALDGPTFAWLKPTYEKLFNDLPNMKNYLGTGASDLCEGIFDFQFLDHAVFGCDVLYPNKPLYVNRKPSNKIVNMSLAYKVQITSERQIGSSLLLQHDEKQVEKIFEDNTGLEMVHQDRSPYLASSTSVIKVPECVSLDVRFCDGPKSMGARAQPLSYIIALALLISSMSPTIVAQ